MGRGGGAAARRDWARQHDHVQGGVPADSGEQAVAMGEGAGRDMVFGVPEGAEVDARDRAKAARMGYVGSYTRLGNACWFTNLEHGWRHQSLGLMTTADDLRFSRHQEIRGRAVYPRYDNYDAIEVPYVDEIPSDYDGVMGVPITFLDRYCPEQFEILGASESEGSGFSNGLWLAESGVAQPWWTRDEYISEYSYGNAARMEWASWERLRPRSGR